MRLLRSTYTTFLIHLIWYDFKLCVGEKKKPTGCHYRSQRIPETWNQNFLFWLLTPSSALSTSCCSLPSSIRSLKPRTVADPCFLSGALFSWLTQRPTPTTWCVWSEGADLRMPLSYSHLTSRSLHQTTLSEDQTEQNWEWPHTHRSTYLM